MKWKPHFYPPSLLPGHSIAAADVTFSLGLPTFLSHGHKRWGGGERGEDSWGWDGDEWGEGRRDKGGGSSAREVSEELGDVLWGGGGKERKGGEREGNERIEKKLEGRREEVGGRVWWGWWA